MADTYGRGPNGEMLYPQDQYDQWGVYMGNRAPMIAGADTNTGGFNQWTSELPFDQWLTNYAKVQLGRNKGSLAQVTAPQGTPEYRDQVAAAQRDARLISGWGGTVGDMGIRPAKGAGLNMWNQYSGRKAGQLDDWAINQARSVYAKAAAARAAGGGVAGAGNTSTAGGFGTQGNAGGSGSFTPGTGAPAAAPQGVAGIIPGGAGVGRQLPSLPGSNPSGAQGMGPSATDSYMQTPRGSRRGLRGLIGG